MEETRKRYYTVSQNFRWDPGDYELVNEADAFEPSVVPDAYETAGTHEFMFPGRAYPMYLGLPKLRAAHSESWSERKTKRRIWIWRHFLCFNAC